MNILTVKNISLNKTTLLGLIVCDSLGFSLVPLYQCCHSRRFEYLCVGRTCLSQKRKMTNCSSIFFDLHLVLYNNYVDDVSAIFKTICTIKPLQIHLTVLPVFKVDGRRH